MFVTFLVFLVNEDPITKTGPSSARQRSHLYAELPTLLIFAESYRFLKADFHITIWKVKITANNDFKMVPDKITGVTPTSTPVLPNHRYVKQNRDWFVRYLLFLLLICESEPRL